MKRKIFLALYYGIAQYLPDSYSKLGGRFGNWCRIACCKRIFKRCDNICTIGRKAYFGNGKDVEIGKESGIGPYCKVPNNIKIGDYVMMAPEVLIFRNNHKFDKRGMSVGDQGNTDNPPVEIGDNVWIGQRVIINAGRRIAPGTVIAAGAVVTKDLAPEMVIGGNPAREIRRRFND